MSQVVGTGRGGSMGPGEEIEIIISRIVDGEAGPSDWARFGAAAERDPGLWREVALCQRDHVGLMRGVESLTACASRVEAPTREVQVERMRGRSRLLATWAGWGVAAAIGAAVLVGGPRLGGPTGGGGVGEQAGLAGIGGAIGGASGGFSSMQAAWDAYMEKGRERGVVVGEVPTRVLLESRPAEGGGYEVVYLRQVIERARVPRLWQMGVDELGRPLPVPAEVVPASLGGRIE